MKVLLILRCVMRYPYFPCENLFERACGERESPSVRWRTHSTLTTVSSFNSHSEPRTPHFVPHFGIQCCCHSMCVSHHGHQETNRPTISHRSIFLYSTRIVLEIWIAPNSVLYTTSWLSIKMVAESVPVYALKKFFHRFKWLLLRMMKGENCIQ